MFRPKFPTFGQLDLAPAGTFPGVCLSIKDQANDVRPKLDNPSVLVSAGMRRFLFGIVVPSGQPHLVQTRAMKVSTDDRSNLMTFLGGWLGYKPQEGFDCDRLIGKPGVVTLSHRKGSDGHYAVLVVAPLPPEMLGQAPNPEVFVPLMVAIKTPIPLAFQTATLSERSRLVPDQPMRYPILLQHNLAKRFGVAPATDPKPAQIPQSPEHNGGDKDGEAVPK